MNMQLIKPFRQRCDVDDLAQPRQCGLVESQSAGVGLRLRGLSKENEPRPYSGNSFAVGERKALDNLFMNSDFKCKTVLTTS